MQRKKMEEQVVEEDYDRMLWNTPGKKKYSNLVDETRITKLLKFGGWWVLGAHYTIYIKTVTSLKKIS
jgi:hypothetical protein